MIGIGERRGDNSEIDATNALVTQLPGVRLNVLSDRSVVRGDGVAVTADFRVIDDGLIVSNSGSDTVGLATGALPEFFDVEAEDSERVVELLLENNKRLGKPA